MSPKLNRDHVDLTADILENGALMGWHLGKVWNNAPCSTMDGPRTYHTKWSNPENHKYHMISLTCGISKHETNGLIYKTETGSQKTNLQLPKGKGREG